ncbi:glucose-1-phosphate thymidylyltransferase [Candidatus Uhrbacteria bacterium]|nr:glucose-1-phosphate thymidylyltransferase [Candidatus Uhrbacteria bacterium]
MSMKAVIAAGGRGTRLRPITWTLNKHLIPLANEPMLFNALKKISAVGVTEVAINVNPGEDMIQEVCGDGSQWGLKLTYIEQQGGALGVGHILFNAADWIGDDDVLLYFGDNVVLGSLQEMVDRFNAEKLDASFAFVEVEDPERFGVPVFDDSGNLLEIEEKPSSPKSQFAQTGLYIYKMPKYMEAYKNITPSARGEYEIADINTHIIKNGTAGYGTMVGWWKDTGTPEALLEGNQLLLNELPVEEALIDDTVIKLDDVRIQGRVKIGRDTVLGRNVLIRGPVVIGDNVKLDNVYIGPHTTIGNRSEIKNTEIEHSIIMSDSTIETSSKRIVDSIIGPKATIVSEASSYPRGHRLIAGENTYLEL